jgi:dihydropteroate synthase
VVSRVLRLGHREFGPDQLLVMAIVPVGSGEPAAAMGRVHAAVAEGADLVDVVDAAGGEAERGVVPFVAVVRDTYPELVIGVSTGRPEVAREAGAAGADLLGGSAEGLAEVAAERGLAVAVPLAGAAGPLAGAARAVAAGVEPERIIVGLDSGGLHIVGLGSAGLVADLVATEWPVMISLPDREAAGGLATAAVAAWLGVRVFRVHRVVQVRRVLSMVSAIRGDIPPGWAVRGLA